MLIQVSFNTEK